MVAKRSPTSTPPPTEIELIYQQVGSHSHVFTSSSVPGFYYGSTSLERTFKELAGALGVHISMLYKTKAKYDISISFQDFVKHLKAKGVGIDDDTVSELLLKNSVIAKIASRSAHPTH